MIVFQVSLNFDRVKEILKIRWYDVRFIFYEESGYSEQITSDNEDFRSTIFQPFPFEHEQKKMCGNESHEKETKHIYASAADLLHIRIITYYNRKSQLVQMRVLQKRSERNRFSLL